MNKNLQTEKRKPTVEEDENYFVYIKNPLETRRQILECSRKTIYCLQNYERLLLIRQNKLKQIERLKQSFKELMYLDKKFNEKLPKYDPKKLGTPKTIERPVPQDTTVAAKKIPTPITRSEKTELDRLEESLSNIERKIKGLGK